MLLSIDPGKYLGYAIFDNDNELIDYGVLEEYSIIGLQELVLKWNADLAIEMQYNRFNVYSFEKLVNIRTSLEIITILNNHVVYRVYPSQWHKWLGINKLKRKDVKQKTIEYIKSIYPDIDISDNEADAIAIGLYVFNNYINIPILSKDNYFERR